VTVVELRDLTKTYDGGVEALRGVDLRIDEGEMVAIMGPSGSGKSTLLQLIGCLDHPSSGEIRLRGRSIARDSDRRLSALRGREIGFVFQQFHLVEALSAVENVALPLLYQSSRHAERRRRAVSALERVGLGHRMHHRPPELSGGERQRVAIARAIVTEPSMILADEPTGNLDSVTGAEILDIFRMLHAEGATVVVITHDHEVAAAMPRVIHIRDGRVEHAVEAIASTATGVEPDGAAAR
jgi:putative ABC transport system ATP-binding protein